jgi:hypothetical protein
MVRLFALLLFVLLAPVDSLACTLTWNANPEADLWGYRIYESLVSGSFPVATGQVGKVTTFDCGPETDGKVHYFRIAAVNQSAKESAPTPQVSKLFARVVTPPPPPPPPGPAAMAFVTDVTTDVAGATITILGPGQSLVFQDDTVTTWTPVPGFVKNATTVRHAIVWPAGTTQACYRTTGTDGVQTRSACAPVPPGESRKRK